jgi:hypothetical protein
LVEHAIQNPVMAAKGGQAMKPFVAELIGTFAFAGTGPITINDVSGGAVTHVGIALTFGL